MEQEQIDTLQHEYQALNQCAALQLEFRSASSKQNHYYMAVENLMQAANDVEAGQVSLLFPVSLCFPIPMQNLTLALE